MAQINNCCSQGVWQKSHCMWRCIFSKFYKLSRTSYLKSPAFSLHVVHWIVHVVIEVKHFKEIPKVLFSSIAFRLHKLQIRINESLKNGLTLHNYIENFSMKSIAIFDLLLSSSEDEKKTITKNSLDACSSKLIIPLKPFDDIIISTLTLGDHCQQAMICNMRYAQVFRFMVEEYHYLAVTFPMSRCLRKAAIVSLWRKKTFTSMV